MQIIGNTLYLIHKQQFVNTVNTAKLLQVIQKGTKVTVTL